jgi:hypothetical protein
MGFLLKRWLQRSLIAISSKSQGGEQIAKFQERVDRNQRRAEGELRAFRIQHPSRDRKGGTIRTTTDEELSLARLLSVIHRKRISTERMPLVINRDYLKMVGIM